MKKLITVFCILCSVFCSVYGTNEIRAYHASGSTLYATIRNSTGQAFDTTENAFEAWNVMSDYDISLTDHTGGMYSGTFDADVSAGEYTIMVYLQQGGAVDDDDPPIQFEEGYWDGTYWYSSANRLEDIHTDTSELQTDDIPGTLSTIDGLINGLNDITVAQVWGAICESSYSYKDYMRLFSSILIWNTENVDTDTASFKAADGSTTRVTETYDDDGNRTVGTIDTND